MPWQRTSQLLECYECGGNHLKRDCPRLANKGKGKDQQKGKNPSNSKNKYTGKDYYKGDSKGKQKGKGSSSSAGNVARAAAAATFFKGASAMQIVDANEFCLGVGMNIEDSSSTSFAYVFLCCILLSFIAGVAIGAITALYVKKRLGGGSAAAGGGADDRAGRPQLVDRDSQTSLTALKNLFMPKRNVEVLMNDAAKCYQTVYFTRAGDHAHLFDPCPNQPRILMRSRYDMCKHCEKFVALNVGTPFLEVSSEPPNMGRSAAISRSG